MNWPRLDTRWWNLTLGAATTTMVAACGPTITLEEESASASATEGESETEVDPTMTVECNNGSECQPGFECIDDVCIPYDDYCNDGGCCYDDCCYGECYYSECYSDEDCGPQALCNNQYGYGNCEYPEELPSCGAEPAVFTQLLPDVTGQPFVSLAFVEANGDATGDVLVGRAGATELHLGPGDAPPTLLPVPPEAVVGDAVSGDFDGDGDPDLVASTLDGRLLVLTNDGAGGFALTSDQAVGSPMQDLVALQWDGNGTLDVAGVTPEGLAILHLGGGAGTFVANISLPTVGLATSLARGQLDPESFDDLLVQDETAGQIFLGNVSGDITPDAWLPGQLRGSRRLLVGDLGSGGIDDTVGVTPKEGWVLLEAWLDVVEGPVLYGLSGSSGEVDIGDLDGDGASDVVLGNADQVTVVRGNGNSLLSCQSQYLTGQAVGALAVGDFDGNGRDDVAYEGNGTVFVLRTQ